MEEHGDKTQGWTWEWGYDNTYPEMGNDWYGISDAWTKVITLHAPKLAVVHYGKVVETMHHEIAHAITWNEHWTLAHGPEWRQVFRSMGFTAARYAPGGELYNKEAG